MEAKPDIGNLKVFVVKDDEKIFEEHEEGVYLINPVRGEIYVRESDWPDFDEALKTMPKVH